MTYFTKISAGNYVSTPAGYRIKKTAANTWVFWAIKDGKLHVCDTLKEAKEIIIRMRSD